MSKLWYELWDDFWVYKSQDDWSYDWITYDIDDHNNEVFDNGTHFR